jgi:steroid 5-alpha reductase family enzyme
MALPFLVVALLVSLAIQIVMFIPAFLFKTDKLTDISYGLTFIILSLITLLTNKLSGLKIVLFAMILIWGLRLAFYLFIRILKAKKDSRFDNIRGSFFKFLGFWVLQGITVFVILIPALLFFNAASTPLMPLTIIGLVIWIIGISIEGIADLQKNKFKNNPANKDKFIQSGLWKYSRHPNYFGEMLCWTGIYLFTLPALLSSAFNALIGIISPLYIILLIRFVSGVPKLEKYADDKWGKDKAYQEYKRKTSLVILWPLKK